LNLSTISNRFMVTILRLESCHDGFPKKQSTQVICFRLQLGRACS
jgi:hypothetical protein